MMGAIFDKYMKKIEPTTYLKEREDLGSGNKDVTAILDLPAQQ